LLENGVCSSGGRQWLLIAAAERLACRERERRLLFGRRKRNAEVGRGGRVRDVERMKETRISCEV